jgi:hypothetical protein
MTRQLSFAPRRLRLQRKQSSSTVLNLNDQKLKVAETAAFHRGVD